MITYVTMYLTIETIYSSMDEVKFADNNLEIDRRPYPSKVFKGRLPQILLGSFSNTLSQSAI